MISVGKWYICFQLGWRILIFNWHYPRWEFGYTYEWYDGPHRAFTIGPFNLYWNW